jgi:hypothetical protein
LPDGVPRRQKHDFVGENDFGPDSHPNCHVRAEQGKNLADVLKRLLCREPRVRTANLNFFER